MFDKNKNAVRISSGRFAGEIIYYDKTFKVHHIANHPINCSNVKAFDVIKTMPFYYGRFEGFLCCITWRDNTKSYFTASRDPVLNIANSLKKQKQDKLIEWYSNYKANK